jgi:hypothetical protein
MLPFFLPLWETDATVRGAVLESAQVSLTSAGAATILSGGQLDVDARAASPRSVYTAEAHARYARAFDVVLGGGAGPPSDDFSGDASLTGTWTLTPRTSLLLDLEGSLATTFGVGAETRLLELDPLLFAQRLEYAAGPTLSLSLAPTPRIGLTLEAGYAQEGAIAADTAGAVGVDSHEGHAAVSPSFDLDARTTLAPELRYTRVHYDHALLDVDLHRGPADVDEVALTAALSRELSRELVGTATAGVSVSTPMPMLDARAPVVAPDVGVKLRWIGRRARVTARYGYAYTSLGPRVGFGQQHHGLVRLDVQPKDGADARDLVVHGTLRFARGAAPLAADPAPIVPGEPHWMPAGGTLATTTLAAGARVDVPLPMFRGFAFTTGFDLTFARARVDPAPPTGEPHPVVTATLTIGLAATVSTDKHRTVARDPGGTPDDARTPLSEDGD